MRAVPSTDPDTTGRAGAGVAASNRLPQHLPQLLLSLGYALALALAARRVSLWGDEGFTAMMVHRPWRQMLADLTHIDVNMALYYAIVKAVTTVAGTGELALRLASIVSVLLAGILLPGLAARTGIRSQWLLPALFWLNPFTLALAVNARPYALLFLALVVTSRLLLRALDAGTAGAWLLWAVVAGLAFYVHMLAVLVVTAQLVYAVWEARAARTWQIVPKLLAGGVLVLFGVPTLLWMAPRDTLNWVPPTTPREIASVVVLALGGQVVGLLLLVLGTVGLVDSVRRRREPRALLPVALLVVPAAALLCLLPWQSLFVDEYLSVFIIPLTMLAVTAVTRWPWRLVASWALVVVFALSSGLRVHDGPSVSRQDWAGLTARLNQAVAPGDAVGCPNVFYRNVLEYYMLRQDDATLSASVPVLPDDAWFSVSAYELDRLKREGVDVTPEEGIRAQLPTASDVWLVGPTDGLMTAAANSLEHHGYRATTTLGVAGIEATRFSTS